MKDYKILIDNASVEETLGLFIKLGYTPYNEADFYIKNDAVCLYAESNKYKWISGGKYIVEWGHTLSLYKDSKNIELTLGKLRELVFNKEVKNSRN